MHAPFMLFEKLRFVSYSCSKILKLTKITQKKKKKIKMKRNIKHNIAAFILKADFIFFILIKTFLWYDFCFGLGDEAFNQQKLLANEKQHH